MFRRHQARPATLCDRGHGRRGGSVLLDPLPHGVALHLGESCLDVQEGTTCRRRDVGRGVGCSEANAALFQLTYEPDQLAGEPPQLVEVEYDQHTITVEVVEVYLEAGSVCVGAAAAVVEDTPATGFGRVMPSAGLCRAESTIPGLALSFALGGSA